MCGRVTLSHDKEALLLFLEQTYGITSPQLDNYRPSYNVSPGDSLVAVIYDGENYRAGLLKWGFIPSHAPNDKTKHINARSEDLLKRDSFKHAFLHRRCVLIVDGYYEWQTTSDGGNPYHFHFAKHTFICLAGIWSSYLLPDGTKSYTCAVLTTNPNPIAKQVHRRMPVILTPESEKLWLTTPASEPDKLQSLLIPYPYSDLKMTPVSKLVNHTAYDVPECISSILD